MKNGDYIREMDDERLSRFLFIWSVNSVTSFFEHGGEQLMNALELREWVKSEDFLCTETHVGDEFSFGQDYRDKYPKHDKEIEVEHG